MQKMQNLPLLGTSLFHFRAMQYSQTCVIYGELIYAWKMGLSGETWILSRFEPAELNLTKFAVVSSQIEKM